jgi:tripartite ATP-independent transporter DctP family solute receptor
MTKKTLAYLLMTMLLLALTGCGSQTAEKNATIVLKANDVHSADFPTAQSTKYFGQLLEERSGGRIKLQLYTDGQLGDGKVIDDAVNDGVLDIDREGFDHFAADIPLLQAFTMPYIFRDNAHVWKVLEGSIGEQVKSSLKDKDKVVLAFYDAGMRSFYGMKPMTTPADLSGLRIRMLGGDVFKNMLSILQAQSVSVAYNDIYPSLQFAKLDAAENNIPSYLSAKHYELAKYYTLDEHVAIPEVLFISRQAWDKLSPDDQKLLMDCGAEAQAYERKLWNDYSQKGIEELKTQGVQFIQPDKAAFTAAMQPLYEKYPQLLPMIKEIQAVK